MFNAHVREMLARSAGLSDVAAALDRMIEISSLCEIVTTEEVTNGLMKKMALALNL